MCAFFERLLYAPSKCDLAPRAKACTKAVAFVDESEARAACFTLSEEVLSVVHFESGRQQGNY
jgi:hypothetical protein